jgi:VanZ family protein
MRWNDRVRRPLRIAWVVTIVLVVAGSLLPSSSFTMTSLGRLHISDKVLHFAAYAILAFLPSLHERWPALAAVLVAVLALGVSLEFAQNYAPGRSFELADMAADTAGAVAGVIIALPLRA